jgi:D-alanyl-D-alanine carboxypeptidase
MPCWARKWAVVFGLLACGFAITAEAAVNRRNQTYRPAQQQRGPARSAIEQQDYMFSAEKYAAIVMDAKTGEVLYARNADARRYPASLTKMMTLYLLFEAMEQGKYTKKSYLTASRRASMQPQTNISLRAGEKIPVETAIHALVVRSANDVAVVVAESLGGTVENFAQRMTNKARQLGMRGTVFKNPHGLPDYNQHTTARDMAKLAIALRRDFPQYYDSFSVRKFSWKRANYVTHNRVMLRYAGADGIKTGYINASGFNVVTSVQRNGRTLIGAVFGGNNASARDDRMIALLEQTEAKLMARGNMIANLQPQNLPNPIARAAAPVVQAQAPAPVPQPVAAPTPPSPQVAMRDVNDVNARDVNARPASMPVVIRGASQPVPISTKVPARSPFAVMEASDVRNMRAQREQVAQGDTDADSVFRWGIQVGAFENKTQAEDAAKKAYSIAFTALRSSRIAVKGADASSKTIHRARLENLTEDQARDACQMLISSQSPCFIYRAN